MRQAWIDNLRDLLAELTSTSFHHYVAGYGERTDADYQAMMPDYQGISLLQAKIELMLNPGEADQSALESEVSRALSLL